MVVRRSRGRAGRGGNKKSPSGMDGPRLGSVYYDCVLLAHATRTATRKAVMVLDVVLRAGN